jgi:hypothetical protein
MRKVFRVIQLRKFNREVGNSNRKVKVNRSKGQKIIQIQKKYMKIQG